MKNKLLLAVFLFSIQSAFSQETNSPKREMRGVWISSIYNIDWPAKKGLEKKEQKESLIAMLDEHQKTGINAIFLQVRPSSDAFYRSKYEPWSEWLMGEQGKKPWYDPLKFILKEAHARGMEVHAWFNPFRAISNKAKDDISKKHISKLHPEWMVDYHKGTYINPGIPEARKYIIKLVTDVVKRYDIDGVHFDDYFYPYPVKGQPFNDEETFKKHGSLFTDKGDWRRANVDNFIQTLHVNIANEKPYIKFGVSPFGVWRNKVNDELGSATRAGIPSYDSIYADTRKWLEKEWIDYSAPQLYWSMDFKPAAFGVLLPWWADNSFGKHLYIGHALYKIQNNYDSAWYDLNEIPNQLNAVREASPLAHGSILFRSKFLLDNYGGMEKKLQDSIYQNPAFVPQMSWKDVIPPLPPRKVKVEYASNGATIKWKKPNRSVGGERAKYYAIYRYSKGEEFNKDDSSQLFKIIGASESKFFDSQGAKYVYKVSSLDRNWNESEFAE
ncbi:MAG: uncharacterized lipoprotein YddW (UPF0748 family) [Flammeovirgaceae bacterium]